MLIKKVEVLKAYIGTIQKNTNINTVLPFADQADLKYLKPYIGMQQLMELELAIEEDTLSEDQKALMKYLGRASAFYTLLEALPFLNVSIGDAGIMENQVDGMAATRQWSFFKLEETTATNADVFLDMALEHLELHKDKFQAWATSEAYAQSKQLFIPTAAELSKYLNLQGSRRAFLALVPFQQRAEDIYLVPVLGNQLHQELKDALVSADPLSDTHRQLLKLIRPALAQLTLYEAIPELAYTITGSGIKVLNDNDGIRQRLNTSRDEKNDLRVIADTRANIYMEDLKRFLDTLLQEGETDPADRQQAVQPIDNCNSTSFWV